MSSTHLIFMITVCSLFLVGALKAGSSIIEKSDHMNAALFEALDN